MSKKAICPGCGLLTIFEKSMVIGKVVFRDIRITTIMEGMAVMTAGIRKNIPISG